MGQKVHPHGFRVGVIKDWVTKWYAEKEQFGELLVADKKIRDYVKKACFAAGCPRIEIERKGDDRIVLTIWAGKPGMVIGRQGAGIEQLKKDLKKTFGQEFLINVNEVKNSDMDAQLVAENIAAQLEKRISFRRAMKQAMSRAMKAGALGIKTMVSGRLGGAEIARSEHYHEGSIPLQTLRADVDYGFAEADTPAGRIGVKTWIYRGEVYKQSRQKDSATERSDV